MLYHTVDGYAVVYTTVIMALPHDIYHLALSCQLLTRVLIAKS